MSGIEFWRDERGNVAILVALTLTVLMGFVALGVDVASLYRAKAQLQSVSDLTAVSAMRAPEDASPRAQQAVRGNTLAPETLSEVQTGRYLRNPEVPREQRFTPLAADMPGVNAVRVSLVRSTPLHFAKAISDSSEVAMTTTATAARTGAASFSLTSHLARLDGVALNEALSQGLGVEIALTAGEIALLAETDLSVGDLLAALGQQTGLGGRNPAAILDAHTTVPAMIRAAQAVAPAAVGTALGAALNSPNAVAVAALVSGADSTLGLTMSEATTQIQLSALDMLRGLARVGLTEHALSTDLGVGIPGVLQAESQVEIGEPVQHSGWLALGEAGVTLHRAAAALQADVEIAPAVLGNLGTGVVATNVNLPLVVELTGATATLDRLACDAADANSEMAHFVTNHTPMHPANGTSVAALYLGVLDEDATAGAIDPGELGFADILELEVRVNLLLTELVVDGLIVQARSHVTVGASQTDSISFSAGDIVAGRTTGYFGSGEVLQTAVAGLLDPANTEIRLKPGQTGLLNETVSGVLSLVMALLPERLLSALLIPVDSTLDGLLNAAGLRLGEGELTLTGHHCELIRLVQ